MSKEAVIGLGILAAVASGCGSSEKGIKIVSEQFESTGAASLMSGMGLVQRSAAAVDMTHFSLCVSRIRLINEDGESEVGDSTANSDGHEHEHEESDEIRFEPGLIDLSSGEEKEWDTVELPTGFKLEKLRVKVKKDKDLCGDVDYSVKFNDVEHTEAIEFKWEFDPAIELDDTTEKLTLSFGEVVSAIRTAIESDPTSNALKAAIEEVSGSGKAE